MDDAVASAAPSTWSFAAATLLVLGGVSTAAQAVAASYTGAVEQFDWRLSTGGAVALVGALYMKVRCASWDVWKRRIWVWIATTAALAGLSMHAASQEALDDATGSADVSTASRGGTGTNATEPPGSPSAEEVQAAVLDAMAALDKRTYVDIVRDARADGWSFARLRTKFAEAFETGDMPAAQYCLLDYWTLEIQRGVRYPESTLVLNCSVEISAAYMGAPLRKANLPTGRR